MSHLCPTCQQPTQHTFRPFCSKRCQLLDLNNWFSGAYTVPGEYVEDSQELVTNTDESNDEV